MNNKLYWLYRHHDDIESIINAISSAKLPNDFQVKFLFLISKNDLFTSIKAWQPYRFSLDLLEEKNNILTIKLSKEIKREKRYFISGVFNLIRYPNKNLYVAVTFEKQKFVKNVLMNFFENYYSESSRLHLTSNQIQDILDNIKERLNCEIITDRVVSYSRLNKRKYIVTGKKPRFKESDLRWTEEDYKISFKKAAENDQWVDKISFYTLKENKILFYASLSREGLFKCDAKVKDFYKIVSGYLLNISKKNVDIFSNKSRLENKGDIRPIAIEYSVNVFDSIEQNKKLIKTLSEFPKSSYSVYHGNPYLHVSLVDYVDGSSYDIWVASANKIIIIPQLRATFNSISRLCEHILKRFLEGKIVELGVKNE